MTLTTATRATTRPTQSNATSHTRAEATETTRATVTRPTPSPHTRRTHAATIPAVAAGALLSVLLAGFAPSAAAQTSAFAPTPEAAIRRQVEANGGAYAGDCATAISPRDLGMICTRLVEERPTARVYLAGRTFSEFDTWLFVAQSPLGWRVVLTLPLDFTGSDGTPPRP